MFVTDNSLKAVKAYFIERLSSMYSERELTTIFNWVVMERFDLNHTELLLFNQRFSESDLLYFRSMVKRLAAEEPIQYILGWTEFAGIRLKCDSRALIPRPETEELVGWVLESNHGKSKMLDVCTGSGCIALALKHHLQDSKIFASDLSQEALQLAKENMKLLNLDIGLYSFDALILDDYSCFSNQRFDVWISNPPYIPESDKLLMEKNVLEYEPNMALFVNKDPLEFYDAISSAAWLYLNESGYLYFEIHESHGKGVCELLTQKGFVNIELRKDLQGKDRMIRAQR